MSVSLTLLPSLFVSCSFCQDWWIVELVLVCCVDRMTAWGALDGSLNRHRRGSWYVCFVYLAVAVIWKGPEVLWKRDHDIYKSSFDMDPDMYIRIAFEPNKTPRVILLDKTRLSCLAHRILKWSLLEPVSNSRLLKLSEVFSECWIISAAVRLPISGMTFA